MSIPGFTIPRVDTSLKGSGNEVARYARDEFGDRNPLWVYSQTNVSTRASPANTLRPMPRLLAPFGRIARAVSSLFF